uniref:Uncharacterized protein n=1 Tax=Zea mays TaxID=4577 RepID=B6TT60_MAIZE|nr:hypothetical protein [Zea mays]
MEGHRSLSSSVCAHPPLWDLVAPPLVHSRPIVAAAGLYWRPSSPIGHAVASSLPVLFRGTYWCRFWGLLQRREEHIVRIKVACRTLEVSMMQIFAKHGWSFRNRITSG